MPIRCDGVGVLGRKPTPPGVPRPTGVRSEGSARRAWMTVVRGRADSFVAADSPLVRAKIAKIAKGREERQQLQFFFCFSSRAFAALRGLRANQLARPSHFTSRSEHGKCKSILTT